MTGNNSSNQRRLSRALQILGCIDCLAFLAVIAPLDWMSWTHIVCGLGELPEGRIVGYLARTMSGLYALHGALLIFIAGDVERYLPLIRFLGWMAVVHGAVLLGIDLAQGMPWMWTLLEAPGFAVIGVGMLWLANQVKYNSHRNSPADQANALTNVAT